MAWPERETIESMAKLDLHKLYMRNDTGMTDKIIVKFMYTAQTQEL